MKVEGTVSTAIIDRRRHTAQGALAGIIAALLGVLGVHAFTTGSPQDPDRDLVFVVSTAIDRGQAYWEARVPGYQHAYVVLYEDETRTACGRGLASSGPFECPADNSIYIDLGFLRAIRGDLARAYVIEHELGHHVQKLRGELGGPSQSIELQADCYAGELMRFEQDSGHLEVGDIDAALREAAAVGDDRLRPGSSPETWSHGSSAQRVSAVTAGLGLVGCRM